MQVQGVPNVAMAVAANIVPDVVANVVPDVVANVIPDVVANVVLDVVANIIHDIAPNPQQAAWPVETDLIFVPGTTRVLLTQQSPVMHSIIQDAFENTQVYLMFSNAFPDVIIIPSITRDALVAAAKHRQSTSRIYQHLLNDEQYVIDMSPLVSYYKCM